MDLQAMLNELDRLGTMLDELAGDTPEPTGWPLGADEVDYGHDVLIRLNRPESCQVCQQPASWGSLLLGEYVCGQRCYDTLISPSWDPA
jgi:hypothetical protein